MVGLTPAALVQEVAPHEGQGRTTRGGTASTYGLMPMAAEPTCRADRGVSVENAFLGLPQLRLCGRRRGVALIAAGPLRGYLLAYPGVLALLVPHLRVRPPAS